MYVITNDKAFRRLLEELDDETLSLYGWKYVESIDIRLRLNDDDLDLAYFIAENYGDIKCPPNGDEEYLLHSLEKYLFRKPEEELRDLYHDYIERECVIEDMMELSQHKRLTFIAHLKKCDRDELERFDTVYLN
jgi:rRNA-processing protein FCF1